MHREEKDNKAERKAVRRKTKSTTTTKEARPRGFRSHLSLPNPAFAPNFLLPAAAFAALTKVCLDLLPLLLALDHELDPERQVVRGEVVVGETGDTLQVISVDFSEQASDLQGVGREPDVVNDFLEIGCVVRERQLANSTVRGLEAERMAHAVAGEVAVLVVTQVGVGV
jgi:hypothetical protein